MSNEVPKEKLLALISAIDENLEKKITLYAVGGTGMTLLNLKASTKDIDFTLDTDDLNELRRAFKKTRHGYKIDLFPDGCVFTQQLPEDYKSISVPIKAKFKNITLLSIHPLDIVATKIGRLDERDYEDIKECITKFKLDRQQIEKRGKQIIYAGNEDNYLYNLKCILKDFFDR